MFARARKGIAPRGGRGWTRRLAVIGALAMLAALMVALPSQALDGFESDDANLAHNSTTDWNDFDEWYTKIDTRENPAVTTEDDDDPVTGFDQLTWVQDRKGNPDDIFNGGVKQDHNCPGTKDGSLGGSDSGKFDIDRLYLTHTKHTDGKDYLFLAWVRVPQNSTTASSHIAYEFNRGSTKCTTASDSLISRTAGDRLLVYDFEGGTATSTSPSLKLLTWITDSNQTADCEVAPPKGTFPGCWGDVIDLNPDPPPTPLISDGAVNTVDLANNGDVLDGIVNETLGAVRFGEAGINLSAIPGLDVCDFAGHVTGVARSSGNSGTAQMKDKVGPAEFDLPGCVQETTITTRVSLDDHATINGFDSDFVGDHTGTLTFTLYGPDDTDCDGFDDGDGTTPVDPVYETTIGDQDPDTEGVQGIDSEGPWSTFDNTEDDPGSYEVPADEEGVYNWVVVYSGDDRNLGDESDCGSETVTVAYDQ